MLRQMAVMACSGASAGEGLAAGRRLYSLLLAPAGAGHTACPVPSSLCTCMPAPAAAQAPCLHFASPRAQPHCRACWHSGATCVGVAAFLFAFQASLVKVVTPHGIPVFQIVVIRR